MSQNTKSENLEQGSGRPGNNRSSFRHGIVYGVPVVVSAGLIFLLSSISKFPEEVSLIEGLDKLVHSMEFYGFGFLVYRWLVNREEYFPRRNVCFLTILIGVSFGISDEWHQSYVPGRDAAVEDALFDGLASIMAAVTYHTARTRISFLKRIDETLERKFIYEQ